MNDKLIKIINAAFFYLIWWGCILGIRSDLYYLGPMLTAVFILVHLNMISEIKKEMILMGCCGALALVVESLHMHSGFLSYEGYLLSGSLLPPLWIICIWVTLSATLNHSMFFLRDRWPLMVLCGGFFGPVCYYFAMRVGILNFHCSTQISLLILAVVCGICLPLMYYMNKQIYSS